MFYSKCWYIDGLAAVRGVEKSDGGCLVAQRPCALCGKKIHSS